MNTATHCKDPIDPKAIADVPANRLRNCRDCGVHPGATHHPGCDVERCGCGAQAIACGCGDLSKPLDRWSGVWPGELECAKHGLYCRNLLADGTVYNYKPFPPPQGIRWHVPCEPDDPGAHADLNRWVAMGRPS